LRRSVRPEPVRAINFHEIDLAGASGFPTFYADIRLGCGRIGRLTVGVMLASR